MNIFRWITPQFAVAIATLVLLLSPFLVWAADTVLEARLPGRPGEVMLIYTTECTNDMIVRRIQKEAPAGLRFYQGLYRDATGKEYVNCWTTPGDGRVYFIYEDGDQGMLPMQAFKPRTDA